MINIKTSNINLKHKLYSFDIFDTLITRHTANPRGIFSLMQFELQKNEYYNTIPEFVRNNFFTLRFNHERFLRKISRKENINEININFLYETFAKNHSLSIENKNKLLNLEIETERKNILPINENIELVKDLLKNNKRVILISDMYLSSDIVRSFLIKFDDVFKNIPIYVSNEYGKMKLDKTLYKEVMKQEHVSATDWFHYGDNELSDFECAKCYGINTSLYSYVELEPYEDCTLMQNDNINNPFLQLAIGASKNTRLFKCNGNSKMEFGASYAAGLYICYIEWLINQVQTLGLKRLYFLARDGYILQKMFDYIAKQRNLDIKTSYIYGSREAWRVPSITETSGDYNWAFEQNTKRLTPALIAELLHIKSEEIIKFVPNKYKNPNKLLKRKEADELKEILGKNKEFRKLISEKNEEKRTLIKKYFIQEIDFSDDKFAIVDLQGSGYTLGCLESIVKEIYPKRIKGFFMRSNQLQSTDFKDNHYMFPNIKYTHVFTELFARAPHGLTLGYEEINSKIVPILSNEGKELLDWGYKDLVEGLIEFCKYWSESTKINNINLTDLKLYCEYYKYAFYMTDKDVAKIIASIPFDIDGNNNKCRTFIKAPNLVELFKGVMGKKLEIPAHENIYKLIPPKHIKIIIAFLERYGSLRKFLINLYINISKKQVEFCIVGFKIKINY